MAETAPADLEGLLRALIEAEIEFIVVGGVAAVLHGAPTTTLDLDVVQRRSADNLEKLAALLDRLGAKIRDPAGRDLVPSRDHLASGGQVRLITPLGPLDLLGRLHDGRGYDELFSKSRVLSDGDLAVRVLDLETLIEVKDSTNRDRDRLVLPILRALLEDRS